MKSTEKEEDFVKENSIFFTKKEMERFKLKLKNPFKFAKYLLLVFGAPLLLIGTIMSIQPLISIGLIFFLIGYGLLPSLEDWKAKKISNIRMFFILLIWCTGVLFILLITLLWN
ncbi:MAG: hypothetical protein LRY73_19000 [Bacillus sp. (in: Bacteria)]|nr:hypothetical protein [Bacillus sp. (in: firmicutes)]